MQSLAQILGPVQDAEGAWERLGETNARIRQLRTLARRLGRMHLRPEQARQALELLARQIEELARDAGE